MRNENRTIRYSAMILALVVFAGQGSSQQIVAPADGQVGPPRGENYGDYNLTQEYELGYRWRAVSGDEGKYRSDVNFGNGIRLLGNTLSIYSKDGHGHYFDSLLLTTLGLGGDPYESATLRIEKNGLYRYEMSWRENDYYNPALPVAFGYHLMDTSRRFQDHQVTLFPTSKIRFFAGYGRNTQDGPGLSTVQLFSPNTAFPLFADIRRTQDDYRAGFEAQLFGIKISVLRGWEFFRDDTTNFLNGTVPAIAVSDASSLSQFDRTQPYHGETRRWLVNLMADRSRLYSVNARFAYSGGRRNFIYDEVANGTDRFGLARSLQTEVFGNARRPVLATNLTASLFPGTRFTIANHTAYTDARIDGDGTYTQLDNLLLGVDIIHFQFLGIRTLSNTTDATFRLTNQVGLFAAYGISSRDVKSIEQQTFGAHTAGITATQNNLLNEGRFGLRLRPFKPLTINVDTAIGSASRPFYPVSDKNYHTINGRIQYRRKSLSLTALTRTDYNVNSVSVTSHSSHSRTYGFDAAWSPLTWMSFDADYNKLHLDTASGIAYFLQGSLVNGQSIYLSNMHTGSLSMRVNPNGRISGYVGYTRVQDTANNPLSLAAASSLPLDPYTYPATLIGTNFYQAFPLSFESPLARISVRINEKLRWNAGYQFYRYREDSTLALQNYHAHTGFTSVTWSF